MLMESKYLTAELKEGIILVQFKPNLHLTIEDAEHIVSDRLTFYQNLQAPVLIKQAKIKGINKAAREYLFNKEKGLKNIKAIAVIYSGIIDKMMTTFIFHRHTPGVPHNMFNDEYKALLWLKQYI